MAITTTYMTINKLHTSKCYIGMTHSNNKKYLGSGKIILKAIKKYGRENFIKTELGLFENDGEAHYWEGFYIKLYKTHKNYGGYNLDWYG